MSVLLICWRCGFREVHPSSLSTMCESCLAREPELAPASPAPKAPESVLDEAKRLVDGARGGDYGHPLDDFEALGRFWGAILTRHFEGLGSGLHIPDLPAETVALMLAAIKVNREAMKPKRDNVVDLIGYAYTLELIRKRRDG